jgi:hypothetical protein
MSFSVTRWEGVSESQPTAARRLQILREMLDNADDEHGECSLAHESGWCMTVTLRLRAYIENLDDPEGEARHLSAVSLEQAAQLWTLLASGDITAVDAAPWMPRYPA